MNVGLEEHEIAYLLLGWKLESESSQKWGTLSFRNTRKFFNHNLNSCIEFVNVNLWLLQQMCVRVVSTPSGRTRKQLSVAG